MSKNTKTNVPTPTKHVIPHPLVKDIQYRVTWARATPEDEENRVAQFSLAEVHVPTGIVLCSHNSLNLLQLAPRDGGDQRVLEIGSMSRTYTAGDGAVKDIYSHTFFPKHWTMDGATKAHDQFVQNVGMAVMGFIKEFKESSDRRYRARRDAAPNPLAQQLRELTKSREPAAEASLRDD